jgi:hypothetical protein
VRDCSLQFTVTHKLVFTVTSSLPLLGSGFQRRTFLPCGFPNSPRPQVPASPINSSQRLNRSGSLNSPTNSSVVLLIPSRHGPRRQHHFPLLYPLVAVEAYLFLEPLLINGCCVVTYFLRSLPSNGLHTAMCLNFPLVYHYRKYVDNRI